jgi:hypothetical protein
MGSRGEIVKLYIPVDTVDDFAVSLITYVEFIARQKILRSEIGCFTSSGSYEVIGMPKKVRSRLLVPRSLGDMAKGAAGNKLLLFFEDFFREDS